MKVALLKKEARIGELEAEVGRIGGALETRISGNAYFWRRVFLGCCSGNHRPRRQGSRPSVAPVIA